MCMKIRLIFSISVLLSLILGSCASSNDVTGNGILQKRKYNKGFYLNRQSHEKSISHNKTEKDLIRDEVQVSPKKQSFNVASEEASMESNVKAEISTSNTGILQDEMSGIGFSDEKVANDKNSKDLPIEENQDEKKIAEENENELDRDYNSPAPATDGMFILAVIFAILIPPLGVLIYTNIDWVKVLIALLLTLLFFLPGMIYALLVVFDVL